MGKKDRLILPSEEAVYHGVHVFLDHVRLALVGELLVGELELTQKTVNQDQEYFIACLGVTFQESGQLRTVHSQYYRLFLGRDGGGTGNLHKDARLPEDVPCPKGVDVDLFVLLADAHRYRTFRDTEKKGAQLPLFDDNLALLEFEGFGVGDEIEKLGVPEEAEGDYAANGVNQGGSVGESFHSIIMRQSKRLLKDNSTIPPAAAWPEPRCPSGTRRHIIRRMLAMKTALVGIIMGSDSDLAVMAATSRVLAELGVECETTIVSAHRTPERLVEYARGAASRGIEVIIAGAGGAAHLPGMTASLTTLPVIGVPIRGKAFDGLDSLLSIVQMPPGIPVATVAVDGGRNAGLLAARILATSRPPLAKALAEYAARMEAEVLAKAERLEALGPDAYARPESGSLK